jgi:hypothetical protein
MKEPPAAPPTDWEKMPPNILLIQTDQHNARCMGCAGEPLLQTPSMDRIATEGVRFQRAYCASAHCGPSRVSLLWPKHKSFYDHESIHQHHQ